MVAVLLLHARREQGLRPRPSQSRPSVCCARSSKPPTSAPPSRSGPRSTSSMRGFTEALRLRAPDAERASIRRWRELDPEDSLRFCALRLHEAGMIKSSPNSAHRRGHRLALPQRAQARAEGVVPARSRSSITAKPELFSGDRSPLRARRPAVQLAVARSRSARPRRSPWRVRCQSRSSGQRFRRFTGALTRHSPCRRAPSATAHRHTGRSRRPRDHARSACAPLADLPRLEAGLVAQHFEHAALRHQRA